MKQLYLGTKSENARTHNERFGVSGGVARPTVLCEFGSSSPVRAFVEPPPTPSRHYVRRNPASALQ
jgi:hypothetical protein